jgi:RNA polymerase sigma-70 factor (ECF subfamily)
MHEHGNAIMQFCVARLGEGLAEEVTQEVFVTAWHMLPKYRPEAPLRTWLFGIARHKCQQAYRNWARRRVIARTFMGEIRASAHAEGPASPADGDAHAALRTQLQTGLAKLRDEDRMLLSLWYWKELPVLEIADIMGKSVTAVRKRLTRAQQRLKEIMHATPGA